METSLGYAPMHDIGLHRIHLDPPCLYLLVRGILLLKVTCNAVDVHVQRMQPMAGKVKVVMHGHILF